MQHLTLLGLNSDGQSLVLVDEQGARYTLPIDDQLRSHIRKERVDLESIRKQAGPTLRPRDIQAMLRAGATAEEVAQTSGLDLEHVTRYQSPVLAERRWAVEQALATTLSHHFDAPTFGDLVVDRLATRSVDTRQLVWDATRAPAEPWIIHLSFVQNARQMEATWELDVATATLTALDEQARWLTETTTNPQPPVSLQPLTGQPPRHDSVGADSVGAPAEQYQGEGKPARADEQTENLLAELAQARGTRLQVTAGEEEDDVAAMEAAVRGMENEAVTARVPSEQQDPQSQVAAPTAAKVVSLPPASERKGPSQEVPKTASVPGQEDTTREQKDDSATEHSAAAASPNGDQDEPLPGFENLERRPQADEAPTLKRKSRRRSVPSWDEILFGAKPE